MRAEGLLNTFYLLVRPTLTCPVLCGKSTQLVVTPFSGLNVQIADDPGANRK
jgi:hypothetical protein